MGGLLNIFANNTIISPQRAKHASVCLLTLHIKECFCRSLSSAGEGKHSLYCADLSLSPYFIPPLPGPRKDSLTLSPRNKLGGPGTTHRAAHGSFPPASPPQLLVFFMMPLYRSYFCLLPLLLGHISSQHSPAEAEEMLHAHSSISPSVLLRHVCLNVLM